MVGKRGRSPEVAENGAQSTVDDSKRPRFESTGSVNPILDLLSEKGGRYYPIQHAICEYLEIQDIGNLTRTCTRLSSLYQRMIPLHWNLHKQLGHFVKDPLKFRQTLGEYDGLISGSFSLQFFERVVWPESDMDVFVKNGRSAPLEEYFTQQETYRFVRESRPTAYASYGVDRVLIYHRDAGETVKEVQIVTLDKPPVVAVLRGFYMTAVVNFISCNKAFAIFPCQTFVQKKTYLLWPMDDHFGKLLAKYEKRGWTLERMLDSYLDRETEASMKGERFVGDTSSWMIPITPAVKLADMMPDSVLECCKFTSDEAAEGPMENSVQCLKIICLPFVHPTLKYEYEYSGGAWIDLLARRLNPLGALQALKSQVGRRAQDSLLDLRAPNEHGIATYEVAERQHHRTTFEHPTDWRYFDHLVPGFLRQYHLQEEEEEHGTVQRQEALLERGRERHVVCQQRKRQLRMDRIEAKTRARIMMRKEGYDVDEDSEADYE